MNIICLYNGSCGIMNLLDAFMVKLPCRLILYSTLTIHSLVSTTQLIPSHNVALNQIELSEPITEGTVTTSL